MGTKKIKMLPHLGFPYTGVKSLREAFLIFFVPMNSCTGAKNQKINRMMVMSCEAPLPHPLYAIRAQESANLHTSKIQAPKAPN